MASRAHSITCQPFLNKYFFQVFPIPGIILYGTFKWNVIFAWEVGKGKWLEVFLVIPQKPVPTTWDGILFLRCPSKAGLVHTAGEVVAPHLLLRHRGFHQPQLQKLWREAQSRKWERGFQRHRKSEVRFEGLIWFCSRRGREAQRQGSTHWTASPWTWREQRWISPGPCSQAVRGKQMNGKKSYGGNPLEYS